MDDPEIGKERVGKWLNNKGNRIQGTSCANNIENNLIDDLHFIRNDDCSDYYSCRTEDSRLDIDVNSQSSFQDIRKQSKLNEEFKETLKDLSPESCKSKYEPDANNSDLSMTHLMIKNFLSPSSNPHNIRLLGSKVEVALQRKRILQSGFIIHPLSTFKYIWDTMMLLILMVYLIILPLEIAFFVSNLLLPFHIIWDIICIFDIIINFRTGYRIYGDRFQLDAKAIRLRYIKSWFPVDLLSVLPFNYILLAIHQSPANSSSGLKVLKIVKIMKLVNMIKLLRLLRLTRMIAQYQEAYRLTVSIARYAKLVSLMLLIAHWNGCLQYFIPMLQDFPDGSWVDLYKLKSEPWYIKYGWSLFKTLSHMLCIGYGRFMPMLLSEAFVTLYTMITGATFYALLITNSVASRVQGTCSKTLFEDKLKEANEYLLNRKVPEDIRIQVDSYLSRKYPQRRYVDESSILSEISKPLRCDIIQHTCKDMISCIPFLKNAHPEALSSILAKTRSIFYSTGDAVMKEGQLGKDMFLVRNGELVVSVKEYPMDILEAGSYFGEIGVLTNQRRLVTVKATKTSEILVLSSTDLIQVLDDWPKMRIQLQHDTIRRLSKFYTQYSAANIKNKPKEPSSETSRHGFLLKEPDFLDTFMKSLKCLITKKYDLQNKDDHSDPEVRRRELEQLIQRVLESHQCGSDCSLCELEKIINSENAFKC